MSRKYVTKKLVERINNLTNTAFEQAVTDIMDVKDATDDDIRDFMMKLRRINYNFVSNMVEEELKDLQDKKQKIDDLYLEKLITLKTEDLNDVLFLHKHKRPQRAERTLEVITSELARRSLLNDSSQSDTIYKHGDVDVRSKDKSIGKKANSKRNKANKNR